MSELNPSLAAAEFQLDRSKRQQEADLQLEQRKEALARVTDLIGTQQTALLARYASVQELDIVNAILGLPCAFDRC